MDKINEHGSLACTCESCQPRKRTNANGALVLGLECQNCGKFVAKARKFFGFNWPNVEVDESIKLKFRERSENLWKQRRASAENERANASAEWRQSYESYIASPTWIAKRDEVLKRDNWLCCGCRKRKATQVHHLTYDHLGRELLWELVSVCKECHEVIHPHMRTELVDVDWNNFK